MLRRNSKTALPATRRNASLQRAVQRAVPARFESLELRRHLSASLSGDKLVIETGPGNDTVVLDLGGNGATIDVQENGGLQSFPSSAVKSIEISTGAGDDRITLSGRVITFTKPTFKQIKLPAATIIAGLGNDTIQGGPSDDTIFGDTKPLVILPPIGGGVRGLALPGIRDLEGGGNDVIDGGNGNDTLNGGSGDDTLAGGGASTNGADRFSGGSGRDMLTYAGRASGVVIKVGENGQSGAPGEGDTVVADIEEYFLTEGDDQFFGSNLGEFIDPLGGNNLVNASGGDDVVRCNGGNPTVGNDTVFGGPGNDAIIGHGGTNELHGDEGDDTLSAGAGSDKIFGGAGVDQITYSGHTVGVEIHLDGVAHSGAPGENDLLGADIERVFGSEHDDKIVGNDADNAIDGGGGRDTIFGGAGNDQLTARDASQFFGDTGNDTITGSEGNDTIHGNADNDIIFAAGGNDDVSGDEGDDRIDGGAGTDVMRGGEGADTLSYSTRRKGVIILPTGEPVSGQRAERDTIFADFEIFLGGRSDDRIFGTEQADQIFAGAGNDEVRGLGGNDRIDGGEGDDRLIGGAGNDRLIGRAGTDRLYGQDGSDIFYADDGTKDFLIGGPGRDRFRADAIDRLIEVERAL